MRVFVVEDDDTVIAQIRGWLDGTGTPYELVSACSRDAAIAVLGKSDSEWDLIICDLRIPPTDSSIDTREEYGIQVEEEARLQHPGTPCLFFTGHADDADVFDHLSRGGTKDLYGNGQFLPVVQLYRKLHASRASDYIGNMAREISILDEIDIEIEGNAVLSPYEARTIRIFSRRHRGTSGRLRSLGGLSDARAFRVDVRDASQARRASAFVKIGSESVIASEETRFQQFVTVHIDPSHIPTVAGRVNSGCGRRAALFYSFAERFNQCMFDALATDEETALGALRDLRETLEPWYESPGTDLVRIGDLRRQFISDERLASFHSALGVNSTKFEGYEVELLYGIQHGDLHGGNVLVDAEGRTMLVDFGDVGRHPVGLDAVALEMSLLFHPDRPVGPGEPSGEDGSRWTEAEHFCGVSPFPAFSAACRDWASGVTNQVALLVLGYVHALRQLKYPETNKTLAIAIARSCASQLGEQLS